MKTPPHPIVRLRLFLLLLSVLLVDRVIPVPGIRAADVPGSLARAIEMARYGVRSVAGSPGECWIQNPRHGFNARFTPEGLSMRVSSPNSPDRRSAHSLRWYSVAIGYGQTLVALPAGEVASGQEEGRVEIRREGVVEWFVNRPLGLEHGYTLTTPPPGRECGRALCLEVAVGGDLVAEVAPDGTGVVLRDTSGGESLRYDKLVVCDASGGNLPARIETMRGRLFIMVDDSAAVYPVTIDPVFTQQAYLKASNVDASDHFGETVAISGDTAIVGASGEDSSANTINGNQTNSDATASGAAYVFVRSGSGWTQQAYLKASNCGANDRFGGSVAIDGDTAIVGAEYEDTTAIDSGAAYVFFRSGGVWTEQAMLKAGNAGNGDRFGYRVAVDGELSVVGAPFESGSANTINGGDNNDANAAGAAYVFGRAGGIWSQDAYLKPFNTQATDLFGSSVAVSGSTVVVGAVGEDGSAASTVDSENNDVESAGAVYAFVSVGPGWWAQQGYLKSSNLDSYDQFGYSVAIDGETLVVGVPKEDGSARIVNGADNNDADSAGAAYIFLRSGTAWAQQAYLKSTNSEGMDSFGKSVSISGETVVVGAPFESGGSTVINGPDNNGAFESGAAYAFFRTGTTWTQGAYIKPFNTGAGDQFGFAVGVSGSSLVVGANEEAGSATIVNGADNNDMSSAGAAYVFTFLANPARASLQKPKPFAPTPVGRKSRSQRLTLKNVGGSPLTGIRVRIAGAASRDFLVSRPTSTIAPGSLASIHVIFKPRAKGKRRAPLTVWSNARAVSVTLVGKGK
jgi:hypothetical protein